MRLTEAPNLENDPARAAGPTGDTDLDTDSPLRVLLVEDSPLIRERLAESISDPGRIEIVGQADSEQAAIGMLDHARQLGLSKVIATTDPANDTSHRVLLKAGMRRGELRRNEDGSFTQLFDWSPEPPVDGAP